MAYTELRGDKMLRWIIKKALLCMVLLGLFYYLNERNPQWMQTVGRWIGGEVGNRVSVAVDNMLDGVGEKIGFEDVVEVFREKS